MQSRLFSACLFVRSSVRLFVCSFVCYQPVNATFRKLKNKWTDFIANWHLPGVMARARVDLRGQEVKGQGHRRPKLCLEAWRRHLDPLSRVVGGMQWATEMLPLKGGGVAHFNCTPRWFYIVSSWRTCLLLCLWTDISAEVTSIVVKFCTVVDWAMCLPGHVFSLVAGGISSRLKMHGQEMASGGPFWPLRYRFWPPFDRQYIENGKM